MKKLSVEQILDLAIQAEDKPSKSSAELLEVFDDNGVSLGTAPRLLCHRLGLIHQVVYVMIENAEGKILLQTRGDTKQGRLDIAVGGHIGIEDKEPFEALLREIEEELAFTPVPRRLTKITTYERSQKVTLSKPRDVNRELRHVYYYQMTRDEELQLHKNFAEREEIQEVRGIGWFSIREVLNAIDASRVADGLQGTFSHYLNWKLQS